MRKEHKEATHTQPKDKKRQRRERPFPYFSLEESLVLARSIAENNACKAYSRLSLAQSIRKSPESSTFRLLITSSTAYGLTEGSYQATHIKLTDLGASIVAPRSEEERRGGLVQALFNVDLFKRLYKHFDQHKIPADENLKNTLLRDYHVDSAVVDECIRRFRADGRFVGLIRDIAGAERVSIHDAAGPVAAVEPETLGEEAAPVKPSESGAPGPPVIAGLPEAVKPTPTTKPRVFITHGKNRQIVGQLKDLLTFGKFEAVVAEEHETTSKPVPGKVLDDMRSCSAAIIHVESEDQLLDPQGQTHHRINENVLIEIGAAMALYKSNFILLVHKGIHLPSNLQGLYRCEYEGEKLDYEATMKLLKAFSEFK